MRREVIAEAPLLRDSDRVALEAARSGGAVAIAERSGRPWRTLAGQFSRELCHGPVLSVFAALSGARRADSRRSRSRRVSALDPARLHPQLAADTHLLGALPSSLLLLHREAALHWFILIPDTDRDDLTDLPRLQREELLDDAAALADFLKADLAYPKVNVAALGNVVPQLHLHVVGRRPGDCCWPNPVWGRPLPGECWSPSALQVIEGALVARGLRTV